MFNEDADWNDEADAQILIKTVQKSAEKAKSNNNVKPKVVGKKSLLRTLQTLGSVPEWKSDERQHDSDSDTEAAPTHSKRKKKRRKRTKTSEKPDVQEENGDVEIKDKTATQKKLKNKKIRPPRAKTTSVGEKTGEQTTKSENKPEDADKLSRQQWKNKMKNKRKCKNKYRLNKPDEEVNKAEPAHKQTPKEEITTDSACNNKKTPIKKTEKALKPQKRKKLEETDSCGTSQTVQAKKIKNNQSDGSLLDGSERKVGVSNQQEQTPANKQKPEMSRKQILKREQLRRLLQRPQAGQKTETADLKEDEKEDEKEGEAGPEVAAAAEEVKLDRSASLRSRMEQRLDSARFRYINEVLYSSTSGEAKRMFGQDPQAFWVYHRGYTAQVQKWPVNPVDGIIAYIRQKSPSLVVADFGCGDCKIARSVKNKVHCFDLAATCDLVTVCDMANVPLKDCSVDIAVFCLSLMGTNLADFLAEANRVLKMGGVLKIAEVASRFENVRNFLNALAKLGFKMTSKDTENTHFYSFDFVKTNDSPENRKKFGLQLRACVYKKR